MSELRSLSRRTALVGFGAGSLGFLSSQIAGAVEPTIVQAPSSTSPDPSSSLLNHPLAGLWLSLVGLPSNPDLVVAVPTLFGADGSAVMIYPCTEANDTGVYVKGAAIGIWAPLDDHSAHFTTVQVLSDIDGGYQGTYTFHGYPVVSDDGQSYSVNGELDMSTIRDSTHAVVRTVQGASKNALHGFRMSPGNAGFPF